MRYPKLVKIAAFGTTTTALRSTAAQVVRAEAKAPEIVLYQYEVCPFCNKVRAYLDYHNIPYRTVEVDPMKKGELKEFPDDYRKVPIAVIDGKQVNGSGEIISAVAGTISDDSTNGDDKWVTWVDTHLIKLISPNIYRTAGESLQTFGYIAEHAKFSAWQRYSIKYFGAAAMYMVARKKKKEYGITDERAAMRDALEEWTTAVGDNKFLGGNSRPGLADLCVYGVLRAIENFDTFDEMRTHNKRLGEWYDRTQQAVGEPSSIPAVE